jgi:hypothetical protein
LVSLFKGSKIDSKNINLILSFDKCGSSEVELILYSKLISL